MVRSILAVVAGVAVASLVIWLLELAATVVYPPPPGLDFSDASAVRAAMEKIPFVALVCVLAAQTIGTFSGAWLAASIARSSQGQCALVVGVLVMLAGIGNMLMIPHPVWFWVASLLLYLPSAYLGGLSARCVAAWKKPA